MTMLGDYAASDLYNATARRHTVQGGGNGKGIKQGSNTNSNPRHLSLVSENRKLSDLDEFETVSYLKNLFYQARDARRPIKAQWDKDYRYLRGRYFSDGTRASHLLSKLPPEIFPIVRSTVGWMTDRRFGVTCSAACDPFSSYHKYYEDISDDLETTMQSSYRVNSEESEITLMLWDAFTYGTGISKTMWDGTLAGGMGDAKTRRVDPYTFYPDPAGKGMDGCNYFFEAKKISITELDRRFPGKGKLFDTGSVVDPSDEMPDQLRSNTSSMPRANPAAISPATSPRYGRPGTNNQINGSQLLYDGQVTILECWIRDHEIYTVTLNDDEAGEIEEEHVFDTWRVIVIAGQHVLLDEKAEDIWSHGKHPYDRYVPYDLGEFWGLSLVELLSAPQEIINRLLSSALLNIELTGDPILKEDRGSTGRTSLVNKPGQRLPKTKGAEVEWMEPPRIQSDIPAFLSFFLQRMEAISGLSAITKGGTTPGRNAQGVMDALQEAAFVGIRMALRSLESSLSSAFNKKASLIVENYNTNRMVAIVGEDGAKSTLALRARHFLVPTSNGAVPLEYTIAVEAGSSDDTSRRVREDKYITLFTLGAIDILTLLEALQVPNRDKVMERVTAQQAAGIEPPGQRQRSKRNG